MMLWKLIRGLLHPGSKQHLESQGSIRQRDSASRASAADGGGNTTGSFEAFLRRAETLAQAGQLGAALGCYRECVQAYPQALDAYLGMGSVLVDLWSIDEAVAAYSRALELVPRSGTIFSALLFYSHYLLPDRKSVV